MILSGKPEVLGRTHVPVSLCSPHILASPGIELRPLVVRSQCLLPKLWHGLNIVCCGVEDVISFHFWSYM